MHLSAGVFPPVPDSEDQPQLHTDPAQDRPTEDTAEDREEWVTGKFSGIYYAENSKEYQIHPPAEDHSMIKTGEMFFSPKDRAAFTDNEKLKMLEVN